MSASTAAVAAVTTAGKKIEYHPVAADLPLIDGDEFKSLVESIRVSGLREPIVLYEGKVLDGRNRYRACLAAGVEPRFTEFAGGNPWRFVCDMSLPRRNLEAIQKALIAIKMNEGSEAWERKQTAAREAASVAQSAAAKARPRKPDGTLAAGPTSRGSNEPRLVRDRHPERKALAEQAGISPASAARALALKAKAPEKAEEVRRHGGGNRALAEVKRQEARAVVAKRNQAALASLPPVNDRCRFLVADILGGLPEVKDNSIDCIITDPPYSREYLPVYEALAKVGARVLKPGGSCLVMAGQSYLPEVLTLLTKYLRYQWMIAYLTPGGQSAQLWNRKVNTFWKPVVWLVKGDYKGDWVGDVVKSEVNDNDKRHHAWGQSESGMADLMRRFSRVGDLVLDPFLGGGTTAVVALAMDRRFVGCDIAQEAIDTTRQRLVTTGDST